MKRTHPVIHLLVFLTIFGLAINSLAADRRITPEMISGMKIVTEVALSPDGRVVAYVVRAPREKGEPPGGYRYQVWLVDTEGKNPRPLTAKENNGRSIHWFTNSKRIAFLSRRGEGATQQVYVIPVDGGEAEALTSEAEGVGSFTFSPDEQSLAFTRLDAETAAERDGKKSGKDWRVVGRDFKFTRLYILDLRTKTTRLVTEAPLHVTGFNWSPDGRELVFTASQTPLTDHTYMYQKIYRVAVGGGEPRVAVATEGKLGEVAFSPNGRQLAWIGGVSIHDPAAQSLFVTDVDGRNVRNLTEAYDGSVDSFQWTDEQAIAMVSTEKTSTHFYRIDIGTGQRQHIQVSRPVFSELSFDRKNESYAFAGSSPVHPPEVFFVTDGGALRRLTNHNPTLDNLDLADQFTIEYRAQDGLMITGLVMKPVDYREGTRYPLIVSVHGGPESAVLDGWNTYYSRWGQLLAANGYVVFWPNYRGSTGRGVAYSMKDQKDLGGREFRDVLDGIDYLADTLGLVDKTRVGMGGGSYGGYFSALAATRYTRHFRAVSNFAGITNWISFIGTSDIPMENSLVHWGYTRPYDFMDKMWDGSPIKYINDTQTAVLITHGQQDERVPIGQAWELHTALDILEKVPHEFVIYPREGHGLSERDHQVDFMTRVVGWFDKYVK